MNAVTHCAVQPTGTPPGSTTRSIKQHAQRAIAATPVRAMAQSGTVERRASKEKLYSKVGSKNGLDRTPEQAQDIKGIITEVASTSGDPKQNLTGTHWTLRYSDSTSSSAGKLGPFIGYVEQEFPPDRPGKYYNKVTLGLLKAKLAADYEYVADDEIKVSFTDFWLHVGPFNVRRDFSGQGYWKLRYTSPDLRVLDTNQDHVFVLQRINAPKINI